MTNYIRKLLNDAQAQGFHMTVHGGGEGPDYTGYHPAEAEEAINAVDEAELELHQDNKKMGWALIIDGVAPDERIADCGSGDWIDKWTKENIQ